MSFFANSPVRTRIAPTPSGYLHIGNAASFLLTAKLAQQQEGTILLRIDDMDNERMRPEYLEDIFETLRFLEISYQHGPADRADFLQHFSQQLRLPLYHQMLTDLYATGLVYACTCSRRQLAVASCNCQRKKLSPDTPGAAWHIQVPASTIIHFEDEKKGAQHIKLGQEMPEFIIRKKDGLPAYQVASLVDDLYYTINYIVRGEDLLVSTAAQLYLAGLLKKENFLTSGFYHHPLLLSATGEKLSKSAGAVSIKMMRQQGLDITAIEQLITGW